MKLRKLAVAILFTAALMIPTTFGIPLTFSTFSMVQEAEARTRQSGAWLRQMRTSHGRFFIAQNGPRATGRATAAEWRTNFVIVPANRSNITLTAVRENNSNRAQVRFRINNGSWTSWSRSNASRRVSVPANNGTTDRQVRVRVQVRSEDGRRTTTYNYIIRRASTNTRADRLTTSVGTLTPAFDRNITSYRVNLPWGDAFRTTEVTLGIRAAHPRANTAWDIRSVSRDRNIVGFISVPRNNSWVTRRAANTTTWVGFGETVRVRFRILGAYNTMAAGSNSTRIYTVTLHRGPTSYQQIVDHFAPQLRAATSQRNFDAIRSDAIDFLWSFQGNQSGANALAETRERYVRQINDIRDAVRPGLPWQLARMDIDLSLDYSKVG